MRQPLASGLPPTGETFQSRTSVVGFPSLSSPKCTPTQGRLRPGDHLGLCSRGVLDPGSCVFPDGEEKSLAVLGPQEA